MPTPIILIPGRLGSTRLPRKPLADIGGEPLIVHVWRRAHASGLGPVLVAADSQEIAEVVTQAGGEAVLTRADHASGSDRIFEALKTLDPARHFDLVINLQGDLATIEPAMIAAAMAPLAEPLTDIATLAAPILDEGERRDPNVVKVGGRALPSGHLQALYFGRSGDGWDQGPLYHHIGLYAYRRAALERFIARPPSPAERREKLEQLRALEAGMRIDVALVDQAAFGVDTPADLERARAILRPR